MLPKTLEEAENLYARSVHQKHQQRLVEILEIESTRQKELGEQILTCILSGEPKLSLKVYQVVKEVDGKVFFEQLLNQLKQTAPYLSWEFVDELGRSRCTVYGWHELEKNEE